MMDPSRLLETGRAGLERELLRSALTEVAPESTRTQVLESVSKVLAASAALAVGASTVTASGSTGSVAAGAATSAGTGSGAVSGAGVKLVLGLKAAHAVCLSGVVAASVGVGVGIGVVMERPAEHSVRRHEAQPREVKPREAKPRDAKSPDGRPEPPEREADPQPATREVKPREAEPREAESHQARPRELRRARLERARERRAVEATARVEASEAPPAAAAPDARDAAEPLPPLEARSHVVAQAALANTHALGRHSQASTRPRVTTPTPVYSEQEEPVQDWLGEQLQLLGEARRQLQAGSWEHASSLLDSYEQRFPEGVMGPQITRLRVELRERRSAQ